MKVRATATGTSRSNAIGQVELECTPAGLVLGLYGVGAYSEGYAPGALAHGTRFTISYSQIERARAGADHLQLQLSAPGFPHDQLSLTRFTAGPGVPPLELRKRRLILQFAALSAAVLSALVSAILAPSQPTASLAWGALGYGIAAAAFVFALGFTLDQQLFTRPPGEAEARAAFVNELERYFPALLRTDAPPEPRKKRPLPDLAGLIPRTATVVGITLGATVLAALISGQRLIGDQRSDRVARRSALARPHHASGDPAPAPAPATPTASPAPNRAPLPAPSQDDAQPSDPASALDVERRCICERADSVLWREPIPQLSALLLDKRAIPRPKFIKTRLDIAVVNNSDTPMEEITLHVQFYEGEGDARRQTKERPLYYEGPLRPGEAIKWTTEARGTHFSLLVPDMGSLEPSGQGAASADEFAELLDANHRPVRLHAARMLSFLGDGRGREGALKLKDAMRAAEAPYLRRVLAATAPLRVCDLEVQPASLGACVYNATDQKTEGVGVQLQSLAGSLDVSHPLAHPPELRSDLKVEIPRELDPQSGVYVRVPLDPGFVEDDGSVEVNAGPFDELD